jgi:hypothetical protein
MQKILKVVKIRIQGKAQYRTFDNAAIGDMLTEIKFFVQKEKILGRSK